MTILNILASLEIPAEGTPAFVRLVEDVRGVRVVRLHGPVGKSIGSYTELPEDTPTPPEPAFCGSALFDFEGASECDFVTVSLLVLAARDRMAAKARVGVINPPAELVAELRIAKLVPMIEVFASEVEAIEKLSEAATDPDAGSTHGPAARDVN